MFVVYFVPLSGLAPPPVRWSVLIDKLKPKKVTKAPILMSAGTCSYKRRKR